MQTEGKIHSTNKKQKVQASEMIMLMMTQGQKKKRACVAGDCEARNGFGRCSGTTSCQALPAELRNLGNDVSWKQAAAF